MICPLATRLRSRTSAASSLGSEPGVFTRQRNSPRSPLFRLRLLSFNSVHAYSTFLTSGRPPWSVARREGPNRPDLLLELGIARELTGKHRNRLFLCDRYLAILNEGT